jgi:hypothetical protein
MIMRAVRMLCHPRCRRTVLGLHGMDTSTPEARAAFLDKVERVMGRL